MAVIIPQGDSVPSHLERAALYIIEGRRLEGAALSISEFIRLFALGEPAGRELISGLWRKGWIVIDGRSSELHLSVEMQNRLAGAQGVREDFAGLGSGEEQLRKLCGFDLISGRAFAISGPRQNQYGRAPYVIEPFYSDSLSSPYGVGMTRYLDLSKRELIEALRGYEDFRQMNAGSPFLDIQVVPPERLPAQQDIRFLRLFFVVDRDKDDNFALKHSENRHAGLRMLASQVGPAIAEKVLNQPSALRRKFQDEIPFSGRSVRRSSRGMIGQLERAEASFNQIETIGGASLRSAYDEARLLRRASLESIRERLERASARQATARFLPDASTVRQGVKELLDDFRQQAVLISQTASADAIAERIRRIEATPGRSGPRFCLIQTGGRLGDEKIDTLSRSVARQRRALPKQSLPNLRISEQYFTKKEVFVDACALICDGSDVLLSSSSLLTNDPAPMTGFQFEMMRPARRRGQSAAHLNAATDLIDAISPTAKSVSLRRHLSARTEAAARAAEGGAEERLRGLLDELDKDEAEELSWTEGAEGAQSQSQTSWIREMSRLRREEIAGVGALLKEVERASPMTAEGLHDSAVFDEALELLRRSSPSRPVYLGLRPDQTPDAEFAEALAAWLRHPAAEAHLTLLGSTEGTAGSRWLEEMRGEKATPHKPSDAAEAKRWAGFLPFLICSSGCLIASGGITNRVLVAPRRQDKSHLAVLLKGGNCQEAPLKMLEHLFSAQRIPVPALEDFQTEAEEDLKTSLSSSLYRRWLQKTGQIGGQSEDADPNLGVSALVDRFREEEPLYAQCLADAEKLGNAAYRRTILKAGALSGRLTQDEYARSLWAEGRIFEAAALARDPPQGDPLADPQLRRMVAVLTLRDERSDPPPVRAGWLRNHEEVLALVALALLDPARRRLLKDFDPAALPETPLGDLAKAISGLVAAAGEEDLYWGDGETARPSHAPLRYADLLRAQTEAFNQSRGNKEANNIQAIARDRFAPLRRMNAWTHANRDSDLQDVAEARRAMTEEFGEDYARRMGSPGARENFARDLIENLDEENRIQNPKNRKLTGPKKRGLISAITRFIETLRQLALLGEAAAGRANPERDALRRAAAVWSAQAKADEACVTPQGELLRIARAQGVESSGVGFALWRFPLLSCVRPGLDEARWAEDAAQAILEQEWPLSEGAAPVFEHLIETGRYAAAEWVLDCEEAELSLASRLDERRKAALRRAKLNDVMAETGARLSAQARRLQVDAAQLGLADLQARAGEVSDLYDGLNADAQEIEYGANELALIRDALDRQAPDRLQAIVAAAYPERSELIRSLVANVRGALPPLRLALAHHAGQAPPFDAGRPEGAGRPQEIRRLLSEFNMENALDVRRFLSRIKAAPTLQAQNMVGSASFGVRGALDAGDDELRAFVLALDGLMDDGEGVAQDLNFGPPKERNSGVLPVVLNGGALERWLIWQSPHSRLHILASDQSVERDVSDLGLADEGLPVILNPFRMAPKLSGDHIMINLEEILAALRMEKSGEALKSMVMRKTPLSLILPWDEKMSFGDKAGHLARFLECAPEEAEARLEPERLHYLLARLLRRLRIELIWPPRAKFASPHESGASANQCLSFLSGGSLCEAFEVVRRALGRTKGASFQVSVEALLSHKDVEPDLEEMSLRSFMLHTARRGAHVTRALAGRILIEACNEVWVSAAGAEGREGLVAALMERLGDDVNRADLELLCDWMFEEEVVRLSEAGRLEGNSAHPFAAMRVY